MIRVIKHFLPTVLCLYLMVGSYKEIAHFYKVKADQPKITAMKQRLQKNPESVIAALNKFPNDPKAQAILFKMYVGMHNYKAAYETYRKLEKSGNIGSDLAEIFVTAILYMPITDAIRLEKLNDLKDIVDQRLLDIYRAEVFIKQKQFHKAEQKLQLTLSKIPENDPVYKLVASKIRNLQHSQLPDYQGS